MIHFKLDSNWKILSVIRCSNSHATLSVQHMPKNSFNTNYIWIYPTSNTDIYCQYHKYSRSMDGVLSIFQCSRLLKTIFVQMHFPCRISYHQLTNYALHWKFSTSIIYYTWMCLRIISLWIMMVLLYQVIIPRPDMFFKTIGIIISRHILHLLNISFSSHPFNRICTALPFSYLVCFTME